MVYTVDLLNKQLIWVSIYFYTHTPMCIISTVYSVISRSSVENKIQRQITQWDLNPQKWFKQYFLLISSSLKLGPKLVFLKEKRRSLLIEKTPAPNWGRELSRVKPPLRQLHLPEAKQQCSRGGRREWDCDTRSDTITQSTPVRGIIRRLLANHGG